MKLLRCSFPSSRSCSRKSAGVFAVFAFFLNAFLVVNIHVEISAVLFREGDTLVVDQLGVFNRGYAGADGVLDAFGGVRVRFHAKPKVIGFVDQRVEFFVREFDRLRVAAVSEDRACR